MPYYATGQSRDSYITGVRPGGRYGAPHDVEKRRDNLPENVFSYIRDGVQREAMQQRNEDEARARVRLELLAGKPGRRQQLVDGGDQSKAMAQKELVAETEERHAALARLYAREAQEWEERLAARGLATQRS